MDHESLHNILMRLKNLPVQVRFMDGAAKLQNRDREQSVHSSDPIVE